MDVTPRELRDVEIREAFRGYNRDEVNDLLERAAAAIEALNERTRVLTERLGAQGESAPQRSERSETEEMLHRTLLLAQRASDEAIAEAEEKARTMIEDAETRSRRLLADAAIEARRTTETERQRLEQEIAELQTRRDALSTDVDGLEHFESDYRTRLMGAMEADLHAIERDLQAIRERAVAAPGEKPVVSDTASADSAGDDSSTTREVDVRGFFDDKPRPLVGSGGGVAGEEATTDDDAGPDAELVDAGASSSEPMGASSSEPTSASSSEPSSDSAEAPKAATGERTGTIDLFGAEQEAVASATLDDDSFFASLRDAVRDDAPLGPRDASERAFFDQDDSKDSPNFREAFKRRR